MIDDDLIEWDYGEYEGETTPQSRERIPGWSVWTHPIIGGESFDEVGVRADRFIDRAVSETRSATSPCSRTATCSRS